MKKILIFSGGLDSTVALCKELKDGHSVLCLSFAYGQKHKQEIQYAKNTCRILDVVHKIISIQTTDDSSLSLFGDCALVNNNKDIPEGHYVEESMKATVVPNRNAIMLNIAMGCAIGNKCEAVVYAAHKGDHTIYPDCRPEFVEAMQNLAKVCDWNSVNIEAPFINMSKADIVKLGSELAIPFEQTWSCYKGEEKHCGVCGTCVERKEAFELSGIVDPTEYM